MFKQLAQRAVVFFILCRGPVALGAEVYGLMTVVKGDVRVEKANKQSVVAKPGVKVIPEDTVITGSDSRAKIVMFDRNVINVSPDTKVQISKYINDSKTGIKDVEIKLDQGKVRNNVEQMYDGEKSKFQIKTPTAVAGVRGTQFVTSFDTKTKTTNVVSMRGKVNFVAMADGKPVGSPVVVSKGESTSAAAGQAAEAPKAVPQQQLREMDRETAGAAKKNESGGGDVASADGAGRNPSNESGGAKEGAKEGAQEGGSRAEQAKGPDGAKTDAKKEGPSGDGMGESPKRRMVDSGDMNTDMVKEIRRPEGPGPVKPPTLPGPVLPPTVQPRNPNPIVGDLIRGNNGMTSLKIIINNQNSTTSKH